MNTTANQRVTPSVFGDKATEAAARKEMRFDSSQSSVQQFMVGPTEHVTQLLTTNKSSLEDGDVRKPIILLGVQLPGFMSDIIHSIHESALHAREGFLRHAPAPLVNHSTNICGVVQLIGEAMMVRANGTELVRPKEGRPAEKGMPALAPRQLHHFITDPPRNVFGSVFKNVSSGQGFSHFWENKFNVKYYKDSFRQIIDIDAATAAEHAVGNTNRFVNRWAARSTFSGLVFMTLAAILPDKKEDKQDEERMVKMYADSPLKYVGTRLLQAVNVPEYAEHKRQYLGFGLLVSGMCSMMSGFRNFKLDKATGMHRYYLNSAHSIGGLITAIGGSQLIFSLNNESAWEKAGATMWLRLPIAGKAIHKRIQSNDPTWAYYTSGQLAFQSMNTMSFLMGGVQKLDDGTVVDTKSTTNELRKKYKLPEKAAIQRDPVTSYVDAIKDKNDMPLVSQRA